MTDTAYQGWARLELMGHRSRVGQVREVELYGGKLLRIDIPVAGGTEFVTKFYGASAIYCMTPIAEDVAKDYAERTHDPRPVKPMGYRIEQHSADMSDDSFDAEGEDFT